VAHPQIPVLIDQEYSEHMMIVETANPVIMIGIVLMLAGRSNAIFLVN
jgi:hypothetical protein